LSSEKCGEKCGKKRVDGLAGVKRQNNSRQDAKAQRLAKEKSVLFFANFAYFAALREICGADPTTGICRPEGRRYRQNQGLEG
jgi:hypothetical protein